MLHCHTRDLTPSFLSGLISYKQAGENSLFQVVFPPCILFFNLSGWHEAADGGGLSELERCRKNYAMLNMILDDWMPWHRDNYDFSSIDINRTVQIL